MHEVGHWLGLLHTFNPAYDTAGDDLGGCVGPVRLSRIFFLSLSNRQSLCPCGFEFCHLHNWTATSLGGWWRWSRPETAGSDMDHS